MAIVPYIITTYLIIRKKRYITAWRLAWHFAIDFAAALASENVEVKLLKSSNHRLNDDDAVAELENSLAKFVNI